MATFGEITYMILDLLKERSDDSFFTEEHALFLAYKMRALLLERKYKATRNSSYSAMSEQNYQQICLELEPAQTLSNGCGRKWLKSTKKLPETLSISNGFAFTGHDLQGSNVTFISPERMRYVGYNKWLRNIIYAARSSDGYLYLSGNNPEFIFLERVGLSGIWSDPSEAAALSEEACNNNGICDIMSQPFPLEDSLIPSCIELVVQEIAGPRFVPSDNRNNAKDDMGEAGVAQMRTPSSAENIAKKNNEIKDKD